METRVTYEPPAAMVDWWNFSADVQNHFESAATVHRFLQGGKVTAYNAWGRAPIGLVPFLRLCRRMGVDPLKYLVER